MIGRKRTMLIGLIFFAFMPFAYLFVSDYRALVVIRFFHGLATAIYGPVSMAVVADIAGAKKGELLSWFSSVTIIGNLLGAPLGGLILHRSPDATNPSLADFHYAYLASGAAGILSLVLALGILRGDGTGAQTGGLREAFSRFRSGIAEVLSDRRVAVTSCMEGLQMMAVGALEAFLPIYAVKVAGLNEFQAGMLWGVQVVTTILSKPVMGKTSDRYGRRGLIAAGMVCCAVSFGAVPYLSAFFPLAIAAALFGFGEALVTSSGAALIADLCRERHFGTAMGAFGTIFDVGHASGPILAGVLLSRHGYPLSFGILALLMLVSVPFFLSLVRTGADTASPAG